MQYPFFIGPAYTGQSVNLDAERCVNLYVEPSESQGAKNVAALYPTPGIDVVGTLPLYPCRGLYEVNGRSFAVYGNGLFEILTLSPFTYVLRGFMATDAKPATLCSNGDAGNQLFVTSGGNGYIYDLGTNAFTNVTISTLPGAYIIQGGFLDGYFLALDSANSALFVSDLLDGLTWDPLQYAQRNTAQDNWIGFTVVHREVWLTGSQTSEVWYDAGAFPYPLQPIPGAFLEQGSAASFSVCNVNSTAIWLGRSKDGHTVVWRASGYTPQRVSTYAIEYQLAQYATVSDAVAWTYQDQGHYFFVLTFPTADHTWVYDTSTGFWHERGHWDGTSPDYHAQWNCFHMLVGDTHLTGDRFTGDLYHQNIASSNDANGMLLRRLRTATHLSNEQQWMFYTQAQLDMESGLGGSNTTLPEVMLRTSDDGGHVFSTERWASAGLLGAYRTRVMWRRLGRSRDRVFQVAYSEPTPWRLVNFYLQLEPGTS